MIFLFLTGSILGTMGTFYYEVPKQQTIAFDILIAQAYEATKENHLDLAIKYWNQSKLYEKGTLAKTYIPYWELAKIYNQIQQYEWSILEYEQAIAITSKSHDQISRMEQTIMQEELETLLKKHSKR